MFKTSQIIGIIIDAWKPDMVNAQKIIEVISTKYPKARLIIMMSALESLQALKLPPIKIDRAFIQTAIKDDSSSIIYEHDL